MTSVYLAAAYSTKDQLRPYAHELRQLGFEVTAQWLDEPHAATVPFTSRDPEELRAFASRDIDDVARSDVFLFFSLDPEQPTKRGGRHVEFGLAVATGKRVIVIGPRENIFHFLPEVEVVKTWPEAVELLGATSHSKGS
ncbi:MAG: nucleoside 2-deoxyribosyltransferase [Acidobacteria bacterium]|nr:nucleoside 2-deoxyribosyltransferase [Acidobacteriota bacterium]